MKELSNFFASAKERRQQLSKEYPIKDKNDNYPMSVAYFWPTKYCPIGCEHCMFASPKPRDVDKGMILNNIAIDNFIKMSHEANLESLVVSGGGEPMMEVSSVLKLIENANYNYFEIITGAHWAASERLTRETFDVVQRAINNRRDKTGNTPNFSFRVSIDSYHQEVVKLPWIARMVDILREDATRVPNEQKYPDIKLFFRTLLVEDDTVEQLAGLLGAELGDIENYVREMRFSDDKSKGVDTLSVFYKDMRFVGRAKDVDASKLMEFDQYFDSYARTDQDVRLGMTYLKPGSKGETLDGINVFVTYDGTMMPYGGVPDIKSNIYFESYQQFQARVLKDVVSRTLLFKGLDTVRRIAEEVDPQIMDRIRRKNWIASVADESLDTPEKRLYVTVRLLQKELEAGEIAIDDLPEYVREMVGISPEDLQEQYKAHISSQLQSEHTYGNELVTIFLPNEKK